MIVTIPRVTEHAGYPGSLITLEISDKCPKCLGPRGKIFGTHSFDGSRRLNVDGWRNECGHIDYYSSVRKEGKRVDHKEVTPFNRQG